MTVKGGTGLACASCKYQRRRCTPDCPLAPYFPPDQPHLFRNAHRLFGVSNILKTLARIDPACKSDAMRAILFEADAWDRHPSHGCVAVIITLQFHIRRIYLELQQVKARLAAYCGDGPPAMAMLPPSLPMSDIPLQNSVPTMERTRISDDIAAPWMRPLCNDMGIPVQEFFDSGQCSIQQEYDEILPFFHHIEEEMPYESSTDSSERDIGTVQSLTMDGASELKDAAVCFALTTSAN